MQIIELFTKELTPYANNPRNNDSAVDAVAASIEQFGFKVPIIIDKDNVIVAGHTRLKAALKLGLEKVPCVRADDLSEEQVKAFRLADNKVGELATWDFDKLEEELKELDEFDMSDFGFEDDAEDEKTEDKESKANDSEIYQVIIDCENKFEQTEIFEQLKDEGYKCHTLTT